MVPWDSRIDVLVGLADGVHDGGAGHSVVELDGVDGWGVGVLFFMVTRSHSKCCR